MSTNEAVRKLQSPSFIINQKTLIDILCTNGMTLKAWERDQGFPRNSDKLYDLSDVIIWLINYLRGLARGKVTSSAERIREIKSELLSLELKKKQGEVLEKSYVENQNRVKILAVKQSLLSMGSKLAPLLANRDSREIKIELDRETREIISDFSGINIDKENQNENE